MLHNKCKKVVIGMSGGVDSSVSAWLLKKQGYHVEGLFIKCWEEDDNEKYCKAASDLEDARDVCNALSITLHTINFAAEYWDNVFLQFLAEYKSGRTPNPDILCNKEIKFKLFLEFAVQVLGADFIATGHYVRCVNINKKNYLLRGLDNNKDQSYFLYTLNHKQLSRCLFPVGEFSKQKVRCLATEIGLKTATKKDSTGICFIGKRNFKNFLSCYLQNNPGLIISVEGQEIGRHQGLMYYTLGQRKGLGIGGIINGNKYPWYVVDKDINNNLLIVAQGNDHPCLMSTSLIAINLHWVSRESFTKVLCCTAKTRYRQRDISCLVLPSQLNKQKLKVIFNQFVTAVTPGQSVVFYAKEICLGGGIIE